jgi:hypothetical protein
MDESQQGLSTEQTPVVETTIEGAEQEVNWQAEAEKHRKAFEDQKRRAEIAEGKLKDKPEQKVEKPTPKNDNDRIAELEARLEETTTRANLIARGYTEADEQQILIDAAKILGKLPHEVATHALVKQQIEDLRSQKKTEDVSPSPSKRGGSTTTSVERLAKQVLSGEKQIAALGRDEKSKVLKYIEENNLF